MIYLPFSSYADNIDKKALAPFVSVIVVFKNEQESLKNLVHTLLKQEYDSYEVLLMDDYSTDNGAQIVKGIYSDKIKYFHATQNKLGKKSSLKEAFSKAKGEYILVTDADCTPHSNLWIKSMVDKLRPETDLVLGYGPLSPSNGIVSLFHRFETWHTALQYFAFAIRGNTFMGVGRNMLIKKSSIEMDSLYKNSPSISGDDDLLVSHLARPDNVRICIDPDSFMYSASKNNMVELLQQKSRHTSSSWEYKSKTKSILFLYGASQGIMWLLFFSLLIYSPFGVVVRVAMFFVLLIKLIIARRAMNMLNEDKLMHWFPLLDMFLGFYYWILLFLMFKKPNKW